MLRFHRSYIWNTSYVYIRILLFISNGLSLCNVVLSFRFRILYWQKGKSGYSLGSFTCKVPCIYLYHVVCFRKACWRYFTEYSSSLFHLTVIDSAFTATPDLIESRRLYHWKYNIYRPIRHFFFFFFFFLICVLRPFQEYFTYRADRSSKVGENRRTRRKTTWPSVSRTWLSNIWPEPGSNHSGEKPNGLRVNSLIH